MWVIFKMFRDPHAPLGIQTSPLERSFQGAYERIFSPQTSSGLGLALLNTSGDFSNLHLEVSPKSLPLLEEQVLLSFNEHFFSPSPKLLQSSPLSAGIISSGTTGTCSEVGDTTYYDTLELPRFCMLFSSPIILSSTIFWELKYLRLQTCNLLPKQNHPLSAASLPTFSLEIHFFHSCLGIRFIQPPTSPCVLSNFQSISPFSKPSGEAWTFGVRLLPLLSNTQFKAQAQRQILETLTDNTTLCPPCS